VWYNGIETVSVWDTMGKKCCFVGYNRRKFVKHLDIIVQHPPLEEIFFNFFIPHWKKISSAVFHNGGKPLLLYPISEKTLKVNNCAKINFSAKSILLMNQDPRWSSLEVKNLVVLSLYLLRLNGFFWEEQFLTYIPMVTKVSQR
jgi:hypothetical protein